MLVRGKHIYSVDSPRGACQYAILDEALIDCMDLDAADWTRVLCAWMHDPVDYALSVQGRQRRGLRYLQSAAGKSVSKGAIASAAKSVHAAAALVASMPLPSLGRRGQRGVGPEDGGGQLEVCHPVSGKWSTLAGLTLSEDAVTQAIRGIVGGLPPDARTRFLAVWRLLPERVVEALGPEAARLPRDARVPDHTLFQHADITTGIAAARGFSAKGAYAFLSLSIGPVQPFIEAARSVRDLWSGSALLSWLVFQGMRPVLERLGPTALVFPALRRNPLADFWLRTSGGLEAQVPLPPSLVRRAPSVPNRFLALVPSGPGGEDAQAMAEGCRRAVQDAWIAVADSAHRHADPVLQQLSEGIDWDARWEVQVSRYFNVTTSVLPEEKLSDEALAGWVGGRPAFGAVWPQAASVRGLARRIPLLQRSKLGGSMAGRWQAQLELSARLMDAQRAIRPVPVLPQEEGIPTPPKCSLLGSYEQMGPASLADSATFWSKAQASHLRLRGGERFSAIALTKRFAAETHLHKELSLSTIQLRLPDTATVAAAAWLHEAKILAQGKWNGRWLHQRHRADTEPPDEPPSATVWARIRSARADYGAPPTYYAVLMMDADNMGAWLQGANAPVLTNVLHPKMREYFGQLNGVNLDARCPVGPTLHSAISEALNNFASHLAPEVVDQAHGTMIYSGGDDVLALLPVRYALRAADALRRAFQGEGTSTPGWSAFGGQELLAMGRRATLSAGLAVVHYKHDLRHAIRAARRAEKDAKDRGRNCVTLSLVRRSGEQPRVGLSWDLVPWMQSLVEAFAQGASDRWLYHLRRELPTLRDSGLPAAAVSAEVRRLVQRSQDHGAVEARGAPPDRWWQEYRGLAAADSPTVEAFTRLCLGASFMARGLDR